MLNERLKNAMSNIKSATNIYIGALMLWFFPQINNYLNKSPGKEFKFYGITVLPDWSSLLFGIAYTVFIFVLLLHLMNYKTIVLKMEQGGKLDSDVIDGIHYFNWLLWPFKISKYNAVIFFSLVVFGLGNVFLISFSHMVSTCQTDFFRVIGFIDLFLGFLSLLLFYFVHRIFQALTSRNLLVIFLIILAAFVGMMILLQDYRFSRIKKVLAHKEISEDCPQLTMTNMDSEMVKLELAGSVNSILFDKKRGYIWINPGDWSKIEFHCKQDYIQDIYKRYYCDCYGYMSIYIIDLYSGKILAKFVNQTLSMY